LERSWETTRTERLAEISPSDSLLEIRGCSIWIPFL